MRKRRLNFWLILLLTIISTAISVIPSPNLNISFGRLQIRKEFRTSLGLDLAGGSHLVFEAKLDDIKPADRDQALSSARDTIERRVNFFGVAEANVQTSKTGGSSRIIVELPGIENADRAVALIGKTAQLAFREQPSSTPSAKIASEEAAIFGPFIKKTKLTGKNLKKASVQFDRNTGKPTVALEFDSDGAKLFEDITRRNVKKPVAIFLDNQLISAPRVQQVISGGQAVISGEFSVDEAKQLTTQLNAGALPVPIELIEQRNIGPTLGQESITKSLRAGFVGLFMVAFFMVGYYGRLGIIATVALAIYGLISFAVFKIIPVTLTLSGIAGFMLSIGMAVDANILIFERMREEIRLGRSWQLAQELGFGKAWDSIRDANVATLLTTFILFNPLDWSFLPRFGMVRGFALTLAIGVIIGIFTGVVVTRTLMRVFCHK
jgi:preprotein translocase subunit SecD